MSRFENSPLPTAVQPSNAEDDTEFYDYPDAKRIGPPPDHEPGEPAPEFEYLYPTADQEYNRRTLFEHGDPPQGRKINPVINSNHTNSSRALPSCPQRAPLV